MPAKKSAKKAPKKSAGGKKGKKPQKKAKKPAASKKPKKPAAKKPAPKKEQKQSPELEQAIENIPGLIVEQIRFDEQKKEAAPLPPPQQGLTEEEQYELAGYEYIADQRKKRRTVIIGVSIIGVLVLAMWLWNATAYIGTMTKLETEEERIATDAKAELDDIFAELKKNQAGLERPRLEQVADPVEPEPEILPKESVSQNTVKQTLSTILVNTNTAE